MRKQRVPMLRGIHSLYWTLYSKLCYQYCVPGCTCQSGFVRDTVTNNCIPSYYCPQLYQGYNRYAVYGQKNFFGLLHKHHRLLDGEMKGAIAFCSRKECQCPDGKVTSGTGQCIDPSFCEVQVRKKRQPNKDPLAIVSPVVRDALCIIRNNCPTTTTAKPPCPAYQAYAQCVPCERACNTQYYLCYPYCVTGCTCQSGYVRDTATNNCISSYYCPRLYQGYNRYAVYGQSQDITQK
ncbi:trypsin Inhibitor like cysteine rich domain protein [Ancylostoma ceylanicum]|uniref:Trypsin Inhibitor like cysteine rich domain protein n=1 Tax=Ancylostoma ceylanicum TaxID=53326 RepID=A0A0D6L5H9_9BILA|nr:trypsin Inhibitor like cysteine rich domain protein [Ancylostoma ceylanicum]